MEKFITKQSKDRMALCASDIMTRAVVTAAPEDSVGKIAKLLTFHDISAVPVCSGRGELLGMLSEGDLMRPFGKKNLLKRAWWLNLLAEGTDLAPAFVDYLRLDNRQASDLMVSPVVTAAESASLPEIADLLTVNRIKRVPIMNGIRLVGIVSRADIVRAMANMPVSEQALLEA
jgi:CBS domain-containing protein